MLVVDASCLYEVVVGAKRSEPLRRLLSGDSDHAAPQIIDVEVLSVIRRDHRLGRLDPTEARQAVEDLHDWPGQRYGHRALLARAWELRETVRAWDAMYVALAEALDAPLVTADARLAGALGPECVITVVDVN